TRRREQTEPRRPCDFVGGARERAGEQERPGRETERRDRAREGDAATGAKVPERRSLAEVRPGREVEQAARTGERDRIARGRPRHPGGRALAAAAGAPPRRSRHS